MAYDHHLLWTTRGQKTASKQHLDPQSLYHFFSNANAARAWHGRPTQRIKSAAPRIGGRERDSIVGSPLGSFASLRDPSPTPATSRPLSSRSGISSYSSRSVRKAKPTQSMSPSALYLGLHKARCKSAPPRPADYYLPQRPKTAKSHGGSASASSRVAAKRAWQNRTSSAKSQHSLLPREEVLVERQRERCKSAPLPYDFSSIDVVTSVPEDGSDIQRLKAFTRPLTCMPDVVQNVLSHNGLRHCCAAYQPRAKTASSSRQQFWPVTRPAVFHRGDVPKYLHFVKPAGLWVKGEEICRSTSPVDNLARTDDPFDVSAGADLLFNGDDNLEGTVLYEEQFLIPATPSEASVSERECFENQEEMPDSKDMDGEEPSEAGEPETMSPTINLVHEYLIRDEEAGIGDPVTSDATPELKTEESQSDEKTDPIDQGFEVIITKVEHSPVQTPSPDATEKEPETGMPNNELDGDLQIVVPDIPQCATKEEAVPVEEEQNKNVPEEQEIIPQPTQDPGEPVEPVEPVNEVEDGPPKKDVEDTDCEVEETKPQMNQVKFADSLILTSYKPPLPKKEKKEQPKKPVSILKPAASKVESPSNEPEAPKVPVLSPLKKDSPVQRKVPDKPLRLVKPLPVKPEGEVKEKTVSIKGEKAPVEETKVVEERTEEPPKLEPEVLPKPEYIRAPGAYRMYDPKDLLEYHLEQKRESKPVKKSLTNPTVMPQFRPSPESTEVMTTILDEQKRKREGMKPWLQGRLALSKQTSRFELPMDVRLLEAMTPMDYLTKYCIISTRRKALYKHIFLKVDKDRDNLITFREMDRGLKEIHVDSITTEQVKKLIEMVEGNEKSTFNLAQFSAIAAFSERLLFSETQITEKKSIYSSKEILEEADFCGLKSKLSGFPVNPTVRKILEVL